MQFLEDSEVGDIDVDSPIDDVMATLAALSKASGAVKIAEEDGDMSTEVRGIRPSRTFLWWPGLFHCFIAPLCMSVHVCTVHK